MQRRGIGCAPAAASAPRTSVSIESIQLELMTVLNELPFSAVTQIRRANVAIEIVERSTSRIRTVTTAIDGAFVFAGVAAHELSARLEREGLRISTGDMI
jgi:hypothetical protein